jgi:hypothetical protein
MLGGFPSSHAKQNPPGSREQCGSMRIEVCKEDARANLSVCKVTSNRARKYEDEGFCKIAKAFFFKELNFVIISVSDRLLYRP